MSREIINKRLDEIRNELTKAFEGLEFNAEKHTYTINGKKMSKSVTAIVGKYGSSGKPFDAEYWAKKKAIYLQMTKTQVLEMWAEKGRVARERGDILHRYMELNCVREIEMGISALQPHLCKELEKITENISTEDKDIMDNCLHTMLDTLIPVFSEFRVYDLDYDVAGSIDQIFYRLSTDEIYLFDWKSNAKISEDNKYDNMKYPFHNFSASDKAKYSLQLGLYQNIIEKNTKLKIAKNFIVQLNGEHFNKYKIYKCFKMQTEIKDIKWD